jgi:hypothetical protein
MSRGTSNYWARAVILSPIAASPVLQQVKIHIDRTEVNSDGVLEYFGAAEPTRTISGASFAESFALDGLTPVSENVDYGPVLNYVVTFNEFAQSSTDGRGGVITVPDGLDTSRPLTFTIVLAPTGNDVADDANIVFYYGAADDTTVLDGTNSEIAMTNNVAISATAGTVSTTSFTFPANTVEPGDRIPFGYTRPSGDPYGGAIYITGTTMSGVFWR